MNEEKKIVRIVLTGGPGGGKTSAISRITSELSERGWYTLVVPETATEIIPSGIKVGENALNVIEFQTLLMKKQISKEKLYGEAANMLKAKKIVIIFDRGIMDSKAYMSEEDFSKVENILGVDFSKIAASYDEVIHIVTAAKGAEEYYTLENNSARSESAELAREIDERTLNSWIGHERLFIIGNENVNSFEEKMDRVMKAVYSVIGEPIPIDIQYKYIVQIKDFEYLESISSYSKITQTYLESNAWGKEIKIKKVLTGTDNQPCYHLVTKQFMSKGKNLRSSKIITEEEARELLARYDITFDEKFLSRSLTKERYFFVYEGQYFNIDIYPFGNDKGVLEVHLTDELDEVKLPDFLEIVKDVTADENYRNINLTINKNML